jgi:hypothetical protein
VITARLATETNSYGLGKVDFQAATGALGAESTAIGCHKPHNVPSFHAGAFKPPARCVEVHRLVTFSEYYCFK